MASPVRHFVFLDRTWYAISCEYPTPAAAKRALERLDGEGKKARGALELGVYRHQLGFDGRPVFVSAVSHLREGMVVAEQILVDQEGGRPRELGRDLDEILVARRIRVMGALLAAGASSGSHVVRRPEGRGAVLRPDGTAWEQIGGDE